MLDLLVGPVIGSGAISPTTTGASPTLRVVLLCICAKMSTSAGSPLIVGRSEISESSQYRMISNSYTKLLTGR